MCKRAVGTRSCVVRSRTGCILPRLLRIIATMDQLHLQSPTLDQWARTSTTWPSRLHLVGVKTISQKTKKLHVLCRSCTTTRDLRNLRSERVLSAADHNRLTIL